MDVKVSVVIPTIGRDTLQRAVDSCAGAHEVIVVENSRDDRGGHKGRTRGMAQATGTHLAFMDDDDIYLPGAIDLFKQHAADVPVIFRMDHHWHGILWRQPVLEFGNVSTQMFVVPNTPERFGVWEFHAPGLAEPGGDFTFLKGCADRMGEPIWREEIVAKLRPDRGPTITVVTPWLNHIELAAGYTQAVADLLPTDRLCVVDNGSTPPVGLEGIRLERNLGFARACNIGLEAADTEAVLFLNNDVVRRGPWLPYIRDMLEPGVLVGAQLRYNRHADVDGESFPYLDGWCLAGMRDDLLEIGGFDESLEEPSYYGDNLLCLEARAAGMTLRQADVGLEHLGNRTAGPPSDTAVAAATSVNRRVYEDRARSVLNACY